MMQEVGNDSNGEGAYDFVADAKKDAASLSGASSSVPPAPQFSHSVPVYVPPLAYPPGNSSLAQKPSYEFPPGAQGRSPRPPSVPGASTQFRSPPSSSNLQAQFSANPGGADLSDFLTALPATKPGSTTPAKTSSAPSGSTGPDLNEIFGSDVMSKLPPLNSQKPPLTVHLGGTGMGTLSGSPSVSASPSYTVPPGFSAAPRLAYNPPLSNTFPANLPPPPVGMSASGSVNPYSSQAATGAHLPSFSGLPPLPAHLQSGAPPPGAGSTGLPGGGLANLSGGGAAPPPVQMMSIPPSAQAQSSLPSGGLPPPGFPPLPSFTQPPPPPPFPQQPPQDSGYPSPSQQYGAGAQASFPQDTGVAVGYGMPHDHQHQHGSGGGHSASGYGMSAINKLGGSWFAQTSFDTLKSVTEKAKSTVATIMTTLDPQMKQYGAGNGAGTPGTGPSEQLGKEITVFYIGNETNNMMDAIKMGFEGAYRTVFTYVRSGAAPGHKMQTNFVNALNTATATLNLSRNAPQLQTSLLVAVEPFVVELMAGEWYMGSCVALSVPGGALLHVYSQLSLLPQGLITVTPENLLPIPLDQLITRAVPNTTANSWMEPLLGVSWGATVALAVRQLAANYKRRF